MRLTQICVLVLLCMETRAKHTLHLSKSTAPVQTSKSAVTDDIEDVSIEGSSDGDPYNYEGESGSGGNKENEKEEDINPSSAGAVYYLQTFIFFVKLIFILFLSIAIIFVVKEIHNISASQRTGRVRRGFSRQTSQVEDKMSHVRYLYCSCCKFLTILLDTIYSN